MLGSVLKFFLAAIAGSLTALIVSGVVEHIVRSWR
jgi:uncharacterized iron-regulated membrane protein